MAEQGGNRTVLALSGNGVVTQDDVRAGSPNTLASQPYPSTLHKPV